MSRVDTLLRELSTRHANSDQRFLAEVRPLVEKIVDPALPVDARVPLLELLAETFERDRRIRRDTEAARAGLRALLAAITGRLGL